MVNSSTARADVETLLTKTLLYREYDTLNNDLAYETTRRYPKYTYSIKAQVTVQNMNSKYVTEGIVSVGDLVGLFRYEYSEETNGSDIVPVLVPKKGDEITFLNDKYVIKSCTPATSEDSGIIGWDFTAAKSF